MTVLERNPQGIELPLTWFEDDPEKPLFVNLLDANDVLVAWIDARPEFCDRGHWLASIDAECDLDAKDAWPHFFMSLDRCKSEVHDFILWRLFGQRFNGDRNSASHL